MSSEQSGAAPPATALAQAAHRRPAPPPRQVGSSEAWQRRTHQPSFAKACSARYSCRVAGLRSSACRSGSSSTKSSMVAASAKVCVEQGTSPGRGQGRITRGTRCGSGGGPDRQQALHGQPRDDRDRRRWLRGGRRGRGALGLPVRQPGSEHRGRDSRSNCWMPRLRRAELNDRTSLTAGITGASAGSDSQGDAPARLPNPAAAILAIAAADAHTGTWAGSRNCKTALPPPHYRCLRERPSRQLPRRGHAAAS